MRRLLFLSSISALAACSGGCNGDECGPGDAPAQPIIVGNGGDIMLQYGNLTSGANNDCPDPMAPSGVISVTIHGTQVGGPGLLTFCIGRPDLFGGGVRIGTGLRIIDLNGEANGCMYTFEGTVPVTGMATAQGICDNGKNSAGYALIIDGAISMRRNCPTVTDTVALTLTGTVAVTSTD